METDRLIADDFATAVHAYRCNDIVALRRASELVASAPAELAMTDVETAMQARVAHLWRVGWQPADVARCIDRAFGMPDGALVRAVIAAEARRYEALGHRVAPEWMAQLDAIGAVLGPDPSGPSLAQVGTWPDLLLCAVRVTARLCALPELPRLVDPPDAWHAGESRAGRGALPDHVLTKVRSLLAKAESTTFEAEADAFTAKAQELITRHRIDGALLDAGRALGDRRAAPVGRRIGIDDPYADARAILLGEVARANHCRAVWSRDLGFTTVFGFPDELAGLEELYTSLLLQATSALRRHGAKRDPDGRSRTKRFRRSFLLAFATRIGERLRAVADETVEAVARDVGTSLVPVLAARSGEVDHACSAIFPAVTLREVTASARDAEGWFHGQRCADQADISTGAALTGTRVENRIF